MGPQRLVRRVDADQTLLTAGALAHVDHVDVHEFPAAGRTRTPEAWSREILEGASAVMRGRLRTGWTMLGLPLQHDAAGTVAGWQIAHGDAEMIVLRADSRLGLCGRLITHTTGDTVTFATLVQLNNPVARLVWGRVLPTHLGVVQSLVEGAAERAG